MCQQCVEAVSKHYPDLSEADAHELLISATAFPFGSPEQIERQLAHLRAETDGSLGAALALSGDEFDRDWAAFKAERESELAAST